MGDLMDENERREERLRVVLAHVIDLRAEVEQLTGAKAALQAEIERLRKLNDDQRDEIEQRGEIAK